MIRTAFSALVIVGLLATGVVAPQSAAASPGGVITGRLTDRAGVPLPDVAVTPLRPGEEFGPAVFTEDNGTFRIEDLPPGIYRLHVEDLYYARIPAGYLTAAGGHTADVANARIINVSAGTQVVGINARLVQATYITGRVTLGGAAVRDVLVSARPSGSTRETDWLATNVYTNGVFYVGPLWPGAVYEMRVDPLFGQARGWVCNTNGTVCPVEAQAAQIRTNPGTNRQNINLQAGRSITGRIVNGAGTPIAG
ncbi:MAG: carboxypeptidase-like regulatory domain-containing protein, partial [Promicromonosporaceae bacterium]|nr:carboxypeptidase-like regulatory domain-containing protein [Promicromonosporaceae bacterium]